MAEYVIIDEPRPGVLSRLAVNPLWPLFGFMFGGAFFSWTWSILNSFAIGSPTKKTEFIAIALGLVFFLLTLSTVATLQSAQAIDNLNPGYFQLVLMVGELTTCYVVYLAQSRTFEIYEYFNGPAMTGIPGVVLAVLVGHPVQSSIVGWVLEGVANVVQ